MPESITQLAMKHVSKSIAIPMKGAGFRRQGIHFHRHVGELVHGLHFQPGWPSPKHGSFTINLVITSEWLHQAWYGHELPANPATVTFPVQQRIGYLLPKSYDKWWDVTSRTDLALLSAEVEAAIIHHVLPFFDTLASPLALLERLRSTAELPGLPPWQGVLVHAMLAARTGLRAEALAQLERAAREAGESPYHAEAVRRIAEQIELACV